MSLLSYLNPLSYLPGSSQGNSLLTPSKEAVIVVTGCSSGLGRAAALDLASSGWTVAACLKNTADVKGLEEEYREKLKELPEGTQAGELKTFTFDVRDKATLDAFASQLDTYLEPPLYLHAVFLFHSAPLRVSLIVDHPEDAFEDAVDVGLAGTLRLVNRLLPIARNKGKDGGRPRFCFSGMEVNTVKSSMVALSSTLRLELLPLGIQVALLLPYAITSRSTTSIPSQIPDYIGRHPADSDDALADFSKKTGAMLNQVFSWERLKETETALIAIREIAGRDKVEREYRVGNHSPGGIITLERYEWLFSYLTSIRLAVYKRGA